MTGRPGGPEHLPEGGDEHRVPRWVKGLVALGLVVAVLLLVVLVLIGGDHGPGRHLPGGGDAGVHAPDGRTPPVGPG